MQPTTLSLYIPATLERLPMPAGAKSKADDVTADTARGDFERMLIAQRDTAREGVVGGLEAMADYFRNNPRDATEHWSGNASVTTIVSVIIQLPAEAASSHFKVSGYVPTTPSRAAAAKFVALVLLYSTRAIFFAERRGIDSLLSAVDARVGRYQGYLEEEHRLLLYAFRTLYSMLKDPAIEFALYRFVSEMWELLAEDTRPLMAVGTTHWLLHAMGKGGQLHGGDV
jgi:hypothetical protein